MDRSTSATADRPRVRPITRGQFSALMGAYRAERASQIADCPHLDSLDLHAELDALGAAAKAVNAEAAGGAA